MIRKFKIFFSAFIACVSLSAILFAGPAFAGSLSAQEQLILPHVESNEDFYTGLSLLNTGEDDSEISLIAYNDKGDQIGEKITLTLTPGARFLSSVADIFGFEQAPDIAWLKLLYRGNLRAFGLLGNEGQLAKFKLFREGKSSLILPYVISGDGLYTRLYILNAGDDIATVTIKAFDEDGREIERVELDTPLPVGHKAVASVEDFFGSEVAMETSWIELSSTGGLLMGTALVGAIDRLIALPME